MELILDFLVGLQSILYWIIWPYVYIRSQFKPSVYCPPIKSSVLKLSATELARQIRTKEVRCAYVVNEYIKRIQEVNPILNAVVEDRFSLAREEALKADQYIDSTLEYLDEIATKYPLLGVPLTIKESCSAEGMSFGVGCLLRKGLRSQNDGGSVGLLKQAGAILLCVTNTPEYCFSWETSNLLTGATLNPYDVRRSPGGSSGGEGVLLGSGASVIGVGSDVAGSIRFPAYLNCVYGHKPTPGLVSIKNHFPNMDDPKYERFLVIGPLARYAEDLPLLLRIMSGSNSAILNLDEDVNISKLNVFYKEDSGFSLIGPSPTKEVRDCVNKAAQYLQDRFGCKTFTDGFDHLKYSLEMSTAVLTDLKETPDMLDIVNKDEVCTTTVKEFMKSIFGWSKFSIRALLFRIIIETRLFISKSKIEHYKRMNDNLRQEFQEKLGNNGVLLYPVFPVQCPFYAHPLLFLLGGVKYLQVFNALEMPSTSVPIGLDKKGLPLGIQVIAAPNQDRLCLAVAKALETGFGGWVPPSSRKASTEASK